MGRDATVNMTVGKYKLGVYVCLFVCVHVVYKYCFNYYYYFYYHDNDNDQTNYLWCFSILHCQSTFVVDGYYLKFI